MSTLRQNPYVKSDENTTQTAVIRMENQKNLTTVDLIGAIHVGSPLYYQKILSLLQEKDIVLYEMCGVGEAPYTFKEHFLFVKKIGLRKLYQEVADAASHYFNKEWEQKLLPSLDEVIKILDKYEKMAGYESVLKLKKFVEESTVKHEAEKFDERLHVVCQSDAIDYENLPTSRKHADLTKQELYSTMGVFSLENLAFFMMRAGLSLSDRKRLIDACAHAIVSGTLDSSMLPMRKERKGSLHSRREEKIYDLIRLYEKSAGNIGVFYGAGHLPAIEAHLQSQGYVTKNVEYLEAIRNGTEDPERDKMRSTSNE